MVNRSPTSPFGRKAWAWVEAKRRELSFAARISAWSRRFTPPSRRCLVPSSTGYKKKAATCVVAALFFCAAFRSSS
jgi:hypothetical protein